MTMFRKIIFSRVTDGDYFVAMFFTKKDDKQINIKFGGLLDVMLRNDGTKLDDNDLIKCMAYEAHERKMDFLIEEKNYTEDWKNFKINEDCVIEIMDERGPGITIGEMFKQEPDFFNKKMNLGMYGDTQIEFVKTQQKFHQLMLPQITLLVKQQAEVQKKYKEIQHLIPHIHKSIKTAFGYDAGIEIKDLDSLEKHQKKEIKFFQLSSWKQTLILKCQPIQKIGRQLGKNIKKEFNNAPITTILAFLGLGTILGAILF